MKKGVILCTSVEQGAKIIEYWKSLGVDTRSNKGVLVGWYYGVFNGEFRFFSKLDVEHNNIPILTLPDELGCQGENTKAVEIVKGEKTTSIKFSLPLITYPELPEINFEGIEMEVSDDELNWIKRFVFAKVKNQYLAFNPKKEAVVSWNHARPIPQKVKVTKEQIAEAFNTTVDNLEIE